MTTLILADLRVAIRSAGRQRLVTAVVVGTLALGIGASTAIFGIIEALLLRPLPFPESQRLVSVVTPLRGLGVPNAGISEPELEDFRDRSGVFDAITPVWGFDTNLTGGERPERIEALCVSPNYFAMLGTTAQLGRVFGSEDVAPGFAEAAVISDAAWRVRFGADPDILGRTLRFDNDMYRIVGVLPPGFRHPGPIRLGDIEVWVTAGFRAAPFPDPPQRNIRQIPRTIARLTPGFTLAQAQAKLDAFADGLRRQYPDHYPSRAGWSPQLVPVAQELTTDVRAILLMIFAAVVCVLLICCVNITNMVLARMTGRRREFALRRSLGASRWMVVRQVLVENVMLAGLGGVAALGLVGPLQQVLLRLAPVNLPRVSEIGLNLGVLGFVAAASLASGVLVGIIPAVQFARAELIGSLKDGGQGTGTGAGRGRTRAVLVVCEIGFSLALMVGAGLLARSFSNLLAVEPGFEAEHLTVANLWLPVPNDPSTSPYPNQATRTAFIREVLRRVRQLPGVEAAAMGSGQSIPLVGFNRVPFRVEGATEQPDETPTAQLTAVSPDFFKALGTRLIAGRTFLDGDDEQHPVVVIDEATVRRYWAGQDPLGRRIAFGQVNQPQWFEIVGVVETMKTEAFESPGAPHIYRNIFQRAGNAMSVFVRTAGTATISTEQLRREVEAVDPDLPVFGVRSMAEVVSRSLSPHRFASLLFGGFAMVALVLAGLGIYGVTAVAVAQRSREIGLRMALGAQPRDILTMILSQGLALTAGGVAGGLLGASLLTRLLGSLLFGTTPTDPLTYAAMSLVLAVVAFLACYVPATRALRVDPAVALQTE